ncbi:hypothetical protein EVAR_41004_1 [Eumeta japonica]|uniref:Uncharacterized protein n=1 Tax=Eumeta variegata TaxID=151549 RepID=A0A4C1XDQ9_EUMVA|nr:hypothetical protein EVAR_41004_1 [Eumeta japonica]
MKIGKWRRPHSSLHQLSYSYTRKTGDALMTPLGLLMSTGDDDHLHSDSDNLVRCDTHVIFRAGEGKLTMWA